jgi:hypothetical protein
MTNGQGKTEEKRKERKETRMKEVSAFYLDDE